ncbi:MAG: FadR family transcriptional regulator [Alcaligenaceae bacterium]|nr:MAG: FadR family transcriptional regulator [Alcaligenaceae bacterium]
MARTQDKPPATLQVAPVQRKATHLEVLTKLGDEIRAGRLLAGDRLPPERLLSEMLNVSRNSLRESLAILEAVGVIRSQAGSGPRAGTFVLSEPGTAMNEILALQVQLNQFDISDVIEFRRSIENMAVTKLASNPECHDLSMAEALIEESTHITSPDEFARLDMDFHVGLVRLGGNRLSSYMVQMCRVVLEDRMVAGFKTLDSWDSARLVFIEQHRAIVESVKEGAVDQASQALLRHITGPAGFRSIS